MARGIKTRDGEYLALLKYRMSEESSAVNRVLNLIQFLDES